jgi:hypothetical protein
MVAAGIRDGGRVTQGQALGPVRRRPANSFARTLTLPAWWFLVPPIDWHGKPVNVRLSRESGGGGTLDDRAMFEIAAGPLSLPEPRSEEGRRRREQETAHIIQAMQFLYDHGLLPRESPTGQPSQIFHPSLKLTFKRPWPECSRNTRSRLSRLQPLSRAAPSSTGSRRFWSPFWNPETQSWAGGGIFECERPVVRSA